MTNEESTDHTRPKRVCVTYVDEKGRLQILMRAITESDLQELKKFLDERDML